jgi:2-polyprenyl-3-methyl-5-hydroxy-6-metoxy-1,4-benzoquinol methylase
MLRINKENINSPEFFNKKFNGELAYCDMERLNLLAKYYKGGVYVDIGCMDSPMPSILAEKHDEIYALDFADGIISKLKVKYPKVKYQVIQNELDLPFKKNSIDYIVAGEFIEHLEDPKAFLDKAFSLLKKGGYLAISTPFEEMVSQGSIGGKQHLWSFNRDDINYMMNNPEILILKESGNNTIIAWQKK